MAERSEYRTKLDEIDSLMKEGKKEDALLMLDAMNFRKVGNVNELMQAADIYAAADKREEARELLEIAHERSPIGRMIIYRLAIISIELGEYDEAKEYYDEFVEIAPRDNLKYVILYRLNAAKGADDSTLIGILEELKTRDFSEEWAYELAALYHKTGQADKCIDLCDEIILWFGDGPYVERALELKMLYSPLTSDQAEKYRQMRQKADGVTEIHPEDVPASGGQFLSHTMVIPQVEVPTGKFDTVNMEATIRRSVNEIMAATASDEVRENIAEIRSLANDLPFLRETQKQSAERKAEEDRKIDESLKSNFQNYLIEENDGQMSLALPEGGAEDPQIEGQLTIADIMAEWEKTRRAADKALKDADQQKLENEKNQAIEEANSIMEKLSDAAPRLESGATPQDLMKEEIFGTAPVTGISLAAAKTADEAAEEEPETAGEALPEEGDTVSAPGSAAAEASVEEAPEAAGEALPEEAGVPVVQKVSGGYVMPKLDTDGADITVPAVSEETEHIIGKVPEDTDTPVDEKELKEWHPPVISKEEASASVSAAEIEPIRVKVDRKEAERQLSTLTDELQRHIDELNREDSEREEAEAAEVEAKEDPAAAVSELTEEEPAAEAGTEAYYDSLLAEAQGSGFGKEAETGEASSSAGAEASAEAEGGSPVPGADAETEDASAGVDSGAFTEDEVEEASDEEDDAGESGEGSDYDLLAGNDAAEGEEAEPGPIGSSEMKAADSESAILASSVAEIMAEDRAERDAKKAARSDEAALEAELARMQAPAEAPIDLGADGRQDTDRLPHDYDNTIDLGQVDLSTALAAAADRVLAEDEKEEAAKEKEAPGYVTDDSLQQAISAEYSDVELTEDEREAFTYFTPISGMEKSLAMLLVGVRARYSRSQNADSGNIIIMGGHGSGKTTLATSIIKVLQKEIGKPGDRVGKIDGDKLNSKDIRKLFEMVSGGCLIIENAGDINLQTAMTLSLLMTNDRSGLLVILEDSHEGIKRAMSLDGTFSKKFTEKIAIPVLTIDELVNFGEAYARDLGYSIDEMGVLALYDRISRISRADHPTYLTEVKEIVDEAIDRAEHGGFFSRVTGRKFDEKGRRILQEKNFV